MNVLLIDVDSKIANLALMKASTYHKMWGDDVTLYRHWDPQSKRFRRHLPSPFMLGWPELVYISCLFTWNRPMADEIAAQFKHARVLKGGTGFDHGKSAKDRAYMPPEIEMAPPDYSLYGVDYAVGFCNRGCNRSCQFCDVPLKEGKIDVRSYRPPWTWVPDGLKKALLLDNDPALYPAPMFKEIMEWFPSAGVKCSITQGIDIRAVTPDMAAILADLRPWDEKFKEHALYIAWDYLGIEGWIHKNVPVLQDAGFRGRSGRILCYAITGFAPATRAPKVCPFDKADLTGPHAADYYRLEVLWGKYKVYPFAMPFNNDKSDPWIRGWCRFINRQGYLRDTWENWADNPESPNYRSNDHGDRALSP